MFIPYACSFLSGVLTQLRECLTFGCCQLIEPSATYRIVENTPDDPRKRKPDISKAIKLLGWQPKVAV
jgi:nucleoside-diphosphate-sugar epimerase